MIESATWGSYHPRRLPLLFILNWSKKGWLKKIILLLKSRPTQGFNSQLQDLIIVIIFSYFDWICCKGTEGVCIYVCMCVCMCVCRLCASVCGSAHAQTDKLILIQFCKNDLTNICEVCFSQILKLRNRWRHGGHFSHGRNLCPIYFKIGHDVELLHPLFAIWNQQNQSVTSDFMKSRA